MDYPTGCLGKLPLHGDFIRHNATAGEVNEFDQWIQEGIYQGYNELGSRWDQSFDESPGFRFIYCAPRSRRVVAGTFKPSVDRAGRRYPILVYTVLEAGDIGTEVDFLPNSMEPFFQQAGELVASSAGLANLNAFLAQAEPLRFVPDMAGAKREFGRFVLTTTARDYWTAMFGDAEDARRYAAVGAATEGAGTRPPGFVAMRLPSNQTSVEVSFWLEMARRLSDQRALPTLTTWSPQTESTPARLHMVWGGLSGRYFLPLVFPGRASLDVRDLCSTDRVDGRWVDYGRARFEEALGDPSLKLTDVLQKLLRARGA